ncbi:MAG: TldD/PmbA family protein [Aquificae bacterium]|nr:TldD/PmbA family protein [Aquificota bacterium]
MERLDRLVRKFLDPSYAYELYFLYRKSRKVEVTDERPEQLSASEEEGFALRVVKDGRLGFAYSSSLDEEAVKEAVLRASEACSLQEPDEGNALVKELLPARAASVYDEDGLKLPFERKVELAVEMERYAKELDGRVAGVRKATYSERETLVFIKNSHGLEVSYRGSLFSSSISVLAKEDGDATLSWEVRGARRFDRLGWREMVKDAVFKAVSLLKPGTLESASMPVVFFRDGFAMLVDAFSPMFLGEYLVKGKTLLKGKEGQLLASEKFTLVDDGTLEEGYATFPYDGEGVPQQRTPLFEKGVFKGFLHTYATALKTGAEPTGNAVREDYRSRPVCSTTNLLVKNGSVPLEELLSAYPRVFLVLEIMGLHTVDPVSGEFSLGVSGVLFNKGKKEKAVRGVTVAGNIMDVLAGVEEVGSDFTLYGSVGSPSVLVKELTLGGR